MKKIIQSILLASILSIFNWAQAQIEPVSKEVFALGDVKVGTTTIDEIQAKFGKASILRSGKGDGSPRNICYSNMSSKGKAFVVFESGPMGGLSELPDFV